MQGMTDLHTQTNDCINMLFLGRPPTHSCATKQIPGLAHSRSLTGHQSNDQTVGSTSIYPVGQVHQVGNFSSHFRARQTTQLPTDVDTSTSSLESLRIENYTFGLKSTLVTWGVRQFPNHTRQLRAERLHLYRLHPAYLLICGLS